MNNTLKSSVSFTELTEREKGKVPAEIYKGLCTKHNIPRNNLVYTSLRNNYLDFNLDVLRNGDVKTLRSLFLKYKKLSSINLWGRNTHSGGKLSCTNRLTKWPENPLEHAPNSKSHSFTTIFFKEIRLLLTKAYALNTLSLSCLFISREGWALLANGLNEKLPIKELKINYCTLFDEGLAVMAYSISQLKLLEKLDLSHTELSDASGYSIGRIISKYTTSRDELVWAAGLRGETLDNADIGLKDLILGYNLISDKAVLDICSALSHDTWIRSIDLSNNTIQVAGMNEIIETIKSNDSLLLINVKGNDIQISIEKYKQFIKKLKWNVRNCSDRRVQKVFLRKLNRLEVGSAMDGPADAGISAKSNTRRVKSLEEERNRNWPADERLKPKAIINITNRTPNMNAKKKNGQTQKVMRKYNSRKHVNIVIPTDK